MTCERSRKNFRERSALIPDFFRGGLSPAAQAARIGSRSTPRKPALCSLRPAKHTEPSAEQCSAGGFCAQAVFLASRLLRLPFSRPVSGLLSRLLPQTLRVAASAIQPFSRPPRAARPTFRAVRFLTDHPAGNGRIYTGPPRCWRKGRKKGLPLTRQSFLYGGDWQNSAVGSPMQSAYFAAALFFCLLMVEIPSMASTMARMTSSTPRIA